MLHLQSALPRLWPSKIRRQLILGVALVHLAMMSVFVLDLVRRQQAFLIQQSRAQTESLARTLALNSTSWVLASDVVGLEEIVHSLESYPNLRYAMVTTPDGVVLAHTDETRVGHRLVDTTSRSLVDRASAMRLLHEDATGIDLAAPIFTSNGELIGWARIGQGEEQIVGSLRNVTRNGVLYALVAIAIGSVLAYLIGRRLTAELDRLLFVATEIRDGRRDLRMGASHTDEIARLGAGLNEMLDVINRFSRLYAALSGINETIVRVRSRDELFSRICRVLVETGRFEMAWIGWRDVATGLVNPVASCGDRTGFLQAIRIYADDRPEGTGPTGIAIRENRTVVCNDFLHDPKAAPWRETARHRQIRASISLPIHEDGHVVGAVIAYSAHANSFGPSDVTLLEEAAADISYALEKFAGETRRLEAEEAVRQASVYNRTLIEASLDPLATIGPDGKITDVNAATETVTGRTRADLIGTDLCEYFTEPEKARAGFQRAFTEGFVRDYPLVIQHQSGAATYVLYNASVYRDEKGAVLGLFATARDITERRAREHQIREQAELLDKAHDAILVSDLDNRVTFWNRGAERLFGWTRTEALGRTVAELIAETPPAEIDATAARANLEDWRGEIHGHNRKGEPLILETSITVLRNEAGEPTGRLSINTDITEKKRLEERFLRAQRLESVGMLAAGIAHDLNNVLAPISMAAPLLRMSVSDPADLRMLDTLERCADRGAGLVRQILGFAHGISGQPRLLQVKHLIRDIIGVIRETFPKSITLKEEVPSDLWPIMGNATQIHQVLLNLCVNARDAMPAGGTLNVRGENCVLDAAAARSIEGAAAGAWLVLHVADTGIGIGPDILPRIWDPFYTTKAADKGTGLGLSTVRGIVETHHGFITVQTTVGRGTTFRVYLPAVADSATAAAPNPKAARLPKGTGELVLLVDDEAPIRDAASAILTSAGYRVLLAGDGAEASALVDARGSEIAIVITDLDMPRMNGAVLAKNVRRTHPQLKILAMSGLETRDGRPTADEFANDFIPKPFTVETMLTHVDRLLHR